MRVCRECGCSEFDACVYVDGGTRFPCFWVEAELCSFCALDWPEEARERSPARTLDQVAISGGVL